MANNRHIFLKIKEMKKINKGGRPPKATPSCCRYTFRMTAVEQAEFLTLFENSGEKSMSEFIKKRIFNKDFKVMIADKNTINSYHELIKIRQEINAIGVNYNQYIAILRSHFTEQKAAITSQKTAELLQRILQLYEPARRQMETIIERWSQK